jgi:type I restriction enzyme S subunit
MSAIDDESGTIVAAEERPFEQVRKGYTYFEENDILFAKITPCMENGKAAIARGLLDGIGFGSTEFHVLRPNSSVVPEWIWLFVRRKQFREDAKRSFRGGVGQQRVPQEFLEWYLIPLPPLEEQRRIVARVEELMSRIREAKRLRQEAKEEAERLWQSILSETFPKPGTELPEGWRWVRLGEVAKIYAGSPAPQGEQYFREGKWPFVRVQDLGRYGQTTCLKETADYVNEYALQKYRLRLAKTGTILFPKSGAAILTNSRAILGVDAYIVSHLAAIEPLPDRLDTYWAYFWLCTVDMKEFIDNPSYPSLRLSEISKLIIPLPPLEEQHRIVAYLQDVQEKIRALKEVQAQTEAELKRLEQAILDKAFRGEL